MATLNLPATTTPARQQDAVPTRKVIAGGIAGAAATILIFVLNTYLLPPDKPLTADIAAALTTLLSFIIAYFVPPAASDQVSAA